MFRERLSQLAGRIEGTMALCLVARDGIPLEAVNFGGDLDLDLLAAEMVAQARSIANDHRELAVGDLQQLAVTTDRLTLLVSSLAGGYYLLLVLGPEGNYGRARFELRRARLLLDEDLA